MRLFRWIALALAIGLAPPVLAQTTSPSLPNPQVVTNPDWLRKPSGEDIGRFYPDRAQRDEVNGAATLSCSIDEAGRLERCVVVSEAPDHYGFGDAALNLSRTFQMRPKTVNGEPVAGGVVRIPIVFRIPHEGPFGFDESTARIASAALGGFLLAGAALLWLDARRRDPKLKMRGLIGDSLASIPAHWRAAPLAVVLVVVLGVLCRHPVVVDNWRVANLGSTVGGFFMVASALRFAFTDYGKRFEIRRGGLQLGEVEGKVWLSNVASGAVVVVALIAAAVALGVAFALLKWGGVEERHLRIPGGLALGASAAGLTALLLRVALAPATSVAKGELDIRGSWTASQGRLGALAIITLLGLGNVVLAEALASLLPVGLWGLAGLIVGLADAAYYSSYATALAKLVLMTGPPPQYTPASTPLAETVAGD